MPSTAQNARRAITFNRRALRHNDAMEVRMDYAALFFSLKAKIEDEEYLSEAKSDEEREDRERELHETESRDPAYRYGSDHDAGDWEWDDDKERDEHME